MPCYGWLRLTFDVFSEKEDGVECLDFFLRLLAAGVEQGEIGMNVLQVISHPSQRHVLITFGL